MLEKHVLPKLGDRPVGEVTRRELRDLLVKLDQKAPETAKHRRGYISQVFEWAEDEERV